MDHDPATKKSSADDERKRRPVRSYVLRKGRVTEGQRRALQELWPVFGLEADDGLINFTDAFGNQRPVIMEIGFGNGDATWQMAAAEPGRNFLGVEVHKPGVGHLLLKIEEHGLVNVRIACEDAVELLSKRVADHSLDGVRIYFPDPWHKKRHHKRRIVQQAFVALLAQQPGLREGIRGGRLYDAHIAEIARSARAGLVVTENQRDFAVLERHGIPVLDTAGLLKKLRSRRRGA